MGVQGRLDLCAGDVLASPDHDVLAASDDAAIAPFIEHGEITRGQVVCDPDNAGTFATVLF